MPVHPDCQHFLDEKATAEADRIQVWADLKQAIADGDIHMKQQLAGQAAALSNLIVKLQAAYEACERAHAGAGGGGTTAQPLDAIFACQFAFTSSHIIFGGATGYGNDLMPLHFSADRSGVEITEFDEIRIGPYPWNFLFVDGSVTFSVTKKSGGSGSYKPATGEMAIALSLNITPVDTIFPLLGSDLYILLSTGHSDGKPMNVNGDVTLAAEGVLNGGFLFGASAKVVLSGRVAPHP